MISTRRGVIGFLLSLVLIATIGTLAVPNAAAFSIPAFSNTSLSGSYVLTLAGHIQGIGSVTDLEIFVFDGKGNVTCSTCTSSFGTYTVNNDGTGSISLSGYDISDLGFVIADPLGLKVYASATEAGNPATFSPVNATFTRQLILHSNFTLASLFGSYAFSISSPYGATDAGSIAGVGILNSDGKGNVSVT